MFDRKAVVAAVAAMSLGFGTVCTVARAQQDVSQNKELQAKNPAATPDKNKTDDASMTDAAMQQKMDMQEKMKTDLMVNFNDADFVKVASMANADELAAAQAALGKTSNDDVKTFAQHMIDDHTKAGAEMKSLADSKSLQISDSPDVKHIVAVKTMDKLTGADFDKAYATSAVADHQDAIALFKMAADKASDADLKAFAAKCVPTFEMHLKMAQDLEAKTSAVTMMK